MHTIFFSIQSINVFTEKIESFFVVYEKLLGKVMFRNYEQTSETM